MALLNFLGLSGSLGHFPPTSLPIALPLDGTLEQTVDSLPLATSSSSVMSICLNIPALALASHRTKHKAEQAGPTARGLSPFLESKLKYLPKEQNKHTTEYYSAIKEHKY